METTKKLPPAVAALIVVALITLIAVATVMLSKTGEQRSLSDPKLITENRVGMSTQTIYKDGTYGATGQYSTPGGRESITLSVTIHNDKITASSLTQNARTEQAKDYQQQFATGYKQAVVGKKIEEVSLSRVAGSSLTSSGFNNALEQIKTDAGV